jgi:GAF domain-containing protein
MWLWIGTPKVFEPVRCQLGVTHRVLNVSVPEPSLQRPGVAYARAVLERRVIHIPDVLADPEYSWHEGQKIAGNRAVLGVPLLREGDPVGVIAVARTVPEPFTSKFGRLTRLVGTPPRSPWRVQGRKCHAGICHPV